MKKNEVKAILALIAQAWRNAPEPDEATLAIWLETIGDMSFMVARMAVKKILLSGGPYSPTISEIRRAAAEMVRSPFPTPTEAYGQAREAIRTLYVYSTGLECEELEKLHPLVRKVLEIYGLVNFNETDQGVVKGQFMKMYESELKRAQETALLPVDFRKEIEAMQKAGDHAALPEKRAALPEKAAFPDQVKALLGPAAAEVVQEMIQKMAKEKAMN